jgi:hypothetical protein
MAKDEMQMRGGVTTARLFAGRRVPRPRDPGNGG